MAEFGYAIGDFFNEIGGEYIWQFIAVALAFLPCPKRKLWGISYVVCLAVIVCMALFVDIPVPWYFLVYFAMFAIMNALVYNCGPWQLLFVTTCMYCAQYLASCLSYAIAFVVMGAAGWKLFWIYFYIMPAILILVVAGAYFLIVRRIKRIGELRFTNTLILFIAFIFLVAAALLTYWVRYTSWHAYSLASLMGFGVLFSVLVPITLFLNIRAVWLTQENIVLSKMLEKDKAHYEQSRISNEKIQIKYHDLKKFQKDGITDFAAIAEVEGDHEILANTYFTGNSALDIVLTEKALMCERLGINFICTADGTAVDFMKPYHIYSFMVNALENCINSVRHLDEHRQVEVVVVRKDDMCVIKLVNYTNAPSLEMQDGLPATTNTNREEHGFGVKSMQNIVKRYGGDITFMLENHYFTVIAVIPIPHRHANGKK